MATETKTSLRFVPSDVEGLAAVTEVAVFPDRLELLSEGKWVVIRFLDIAKWYRRGWLYRSLARLGWGVRDWPSVADRDWLAAARGRPPPHSDRNLHILYLAYRAMLDR